MKLLLCWAFILFLGESKSATTTQVSPPSENRFGPPYPFTADEIWTRLLKLIALPEGHVSSEEIERSFDLKLPPPELVPTLGGTSVPGVSVRSGTDWYFGFSLIDRAPNRSIFTFAWKDYGFNFRPATINMCIPLAKAHADVLDKGWKLYARDRDINNWENDYLKGEHGELKLIFDREEKCVEKMLLSSHPKRITRPALTDQRAN